DPRGDLAPARLGARGRRDARVRERGVRGRGGPSCEGPRAPAGPPRAPGRDARGRPRRLRDARALRTGRGARLIREPGAARSDGLPPPPARRPPRPGSRGDGLEDRLGRTLARPPRAAPPAPPRLDGTSALPAR